MKKGLIILCLLFLLPNVTWAGGESIAERKQVYFGINGHPLNDKGAYSGSLEQQISQLKSLGLRTYRVNINPAYMSFKEFDRLAQLIALADQQNIRIQPVIVILPKHYTSADAAYNDAKAMTYPLFKKFSNRGAWEMGNEYDLFCLNKGSDGTQPADYDTAKYNVVRGLLKGMLAALHEVSPSSKSVIETSQNGGSSDTGFLQRLIRDGVEFDITGFHYYTEDGRIPVTKDGENALQILHNEFHKPIWITEFDKRSDRQGGPSADPEKQGKALKNALNEIARDAYKYNVIVAEIYELLDQPEVLTHLGVNPNQAQFGILDSNGKLTAASKAVQIFLRSYYHMDRH